MNKPTQKQLDAMVRLTNLEEFQTFVGWLKESFQTMTAMSLDEVKQPQGCWLQGRAKELRDLIKEIKEARPNLEQVERMKED